MPESWTVRGQKGEPSTPVVDIMEGSYLKHEPSHEAPRADEVCNGGISRRAENSEALARGDGAHGAPSPVMGAGGKSEQAAGKAEQRETVRKVHVSQCYP